MVRVRVRVMNGFCYGFGWKVKNCEFRLRCITM